MSTRLMAAIQVSVVIPFFNTKPDMFYEALESVFRQSFQQFEVLIINDGSTNAVRTT